MAAIVVVVVERGGTVPLQDGVPGLGGEIEGATPLLCLNLFGRGYEVQGSNYFIDYDGMNPVDVVQGEDFAQGLGVDGAAYGGGVNGLKVAAKGADEAVVLVEEVEPANGGPVVRDCSGENGEEGGGEATVVDVVQDAAPPGTEPVIVFESAVGDEGRAHV